METSTESHTDTNFKPVLIECKADPQVSRGQTHGVVQRLAGIRGVTIDTAQIPIPIRPSEIDTSRSHSANGGAGHFLVSATADLADIENLKNLPEVEDVWSDAIIDLAEDHPPFWCPGNDSDGTTGSRPHFGTLDEVIERLRLSEITSSLPVLRGRPGQGIVVGVVDAGITATGRTTTPSSGRTINRVIGGWAPERPDAWGTVSYGMNDHGNAMAKLVQAVAPYCELLDMRIFHSPDTPFPARISYAINAYRWAITQFRERRRWAPHILTNSWCLFRRAWVADDYARNMNHPFTRTVMDAIDAGMIVLFCAGNCGSACCPRDSRCGLDVGPGLSIWGANAHPRVMTVGAVTKYGAYWGQGSQGPARVYFGATASAPLTQVEKPDFSCYTAFSGGYYPTDRTSPGFVPNSGTSSATALAAGVVALMKQVKPNATQEEIKTVLSHTAEISWESVYSVASNIGAGVIQPAMALRTLAARVSRPTPA